MKVVNRQNIEFLVDDNTENASFWNLNDWESKNYSIIKDFSLKCTTFVNAGGWIGPFTLFASELFQRVYSLEPDPIAFKELKRNVELNKFINVNLTNKALFDKSVSEISMGSNFGELGGSGTSIFQSDKSIKVPCITLKEFFSTNNIPPLQSFLMLDTEGSEYILFDDVNFFETYKPIILIEFHIKFLNNENYNHLITSLNNLKHLYKIDTEALKNKKIIHQLILPI